MDVRRVMGWWMLASLLSALLLSGLLAGPTAAALDRDGAARDPLSPELREIADAGPLRVGWLRGAAPVSVWDGDQLVGGFAVDLWEIMASKLGIDLDHRVYDSIQGLVEALRSGEVDVAGAMGPRPDLLEFAEPTEPLVWDRLVLFGRPELAVGFDGYAGLRASTLSGSPQVATLATALPELAFVETASIPVGAAAAAAGEIDLYLMTISIISLQIDQQGLDLVPVGDYEDILRLGPWAVRGSAAAQIAEVGRSLVTNADISLVTVRGTGFDLLDPSLDDGVPPWVLRTLLVLLVATVVLAASSVVLRRRVRVATRELRELNDALEVRVAERTAALEVSNDALDRLAHRAAHDLRGPITAISGFARLLATSRRDREVEQQMLAAIERSASSLDGLIRGLLEDAKVTPEHAFLDGAAFRAWLFDVMGPEVEQSGATMVVEVPQGEVDVNPIALERVAVNLVGNAVKYAVTEHGTHIEVRLTQDQEAWHLVVDDDGPGVGPAERERVFEEGFRGEHVDDRGGGHGLADVRHVVDELGGTVELGSSPSGGARVHVQFPRSMATSGSDRAAQHVGGATEVASA